MPYASQKERAPIAAFPIRHADAQHIMTRANLAAQRATGQNIAGRLSTSNAKTGPLRDHAANHQSAAGQLRATHEIARGTVPIGRWTT